MGAEVHRGPRLEEIREELLECETAEERLEYLIEIGASLPPLAPELCTEEYRVLGCQSMVWLVPTISGSRVAFTATSDAPMVRGLIAILTAAYSNRSSKEILDFPIEAFFEEIQLKSFITPMRSNGLYSMIARVKEIAREALADSDRAKISEGPATLPHFQSRSITEVVSDFPILVRKHTSGNRLVYLDSAASSQRPRQVINAMSHAFSHHYSNVHRSGHELASETTSAMESARWAIARFIHAPSDSQVIFTSGTTSAINLVARAWGDVSLKEGDEILLTEMEHHSNIVPWQQLAARTKAVIRWLPITEDHRLDLDALPSFLNPRTRMVAVTAVSNVLGTVNPIAEIVQAAHRAGSLVLVDAAQSIPHGGVNVQAIDADFVVFSGHKMLGPTGIGVLYGRKSILEAMPPFLGGGSMIHSVDREGFTSAGLPHRFEAGTPPIVEAIAMQAAVEYIESIGSQAILAHERELVGAVIERLSANSRIRMLGPSIQQRTGIFSFTIDGIDSDSVGRRLDAQGIAIRVGHHCAMPLHQRLGLASSCRASFYLYNTLDDASRFCEAIERKCH